MASFNSNLSVPDVKREPEMVIMPASVASVVSAASASMGSSGVSLTQAGPAVASGAVPNMQMKSERLNGYPDDGGGPPLDGSSSSPSAAAWPSNTRNDLQCCLLDNGRRCSRIAGNASYNKRIQKTVAQKKLKLQLDNSAGHIYICDFHKSVIQNMRMKRRRKDSEECDSGETDTEHPEVDLFQLQVNTLRRYKKHYKVPVRQGLNKAQLADNMMRHFKTIPVVEKEALTYFIYMVKTNKSKLDRDRRDGIDAD